MAEGSFLSFLSEYNIIGITIATLLVERINKLLNEFISDILVPFFVTDINNDGVEDINEVDDISFTLNGKKIPIGKFVLSVVKFMLMIFLVFFISKMIKRFK